MKKETTPTKKQVIISTYSYLELETLNKTLEKMLWDSEFSYVIEDADWDINERTLDCNNKWQWNKIK